jgi:hypothetical protein
MRVIVRKEHLYTDALLRFTGIDRQAPPYLLADDVRTDHLADLELRHRRSGCENRIRCAATISRSQKIEVNGVVSRSLGQGTDAWPDL